MRNLVDHPFFLLVLLGVVALVVLAVVAAVVVAVVIALRSRQRQPGPEQQGR